MAYGKIICNVNDYCTIICRGYESCFNLSLVCTGTCHVECNEDTNCPIEWSQNPTSNPTLNPTLIPSINPSFNPTISTLTVTTPVLNINITINDNGLTVEQVINTVNISVR
eukprot:288828_1